MGTWLVTVGVGCAWGLGENDWRRCRIILWPCLLALVLHLVALARLHGTLIGGTTSIAVYAAALAVSAMALFSVGVLEERRAPSSAPAV